MSQILVQQFEAKVTRCKNPDCNQPLSPWRRRKRSGYCRLCYSRFVQPKKQFKETKQSRFHPWFVSEWVLEQIQQERLTK